MTLPLYLAMTAAEISCAPALPARCAFMACHFSPYGTGLSNFPLALPPGSVLILNDRMPVHDHDPELIAAQLAQCTEDLQADAVLLDFQRPDVPRTTEIVRAIVDTLSCPVGVSPLYAQELTCPVFLALPPLDVPLKEHIAPWNGRALWMEAGLDSKTVSVTAEGSQNIPYNPVETLSFWHQDTRLHCRYQIHVQPGQICFHLQRTQAELTDLMQEAADMGIARAIGLYQELGQFC